MKPGIGNRDSGALLLPPLEKGATEDLLLLLGNRKSKFPSVPLFQGGSSMLELFDSRSSIPHSPSSIPCSEGASA